MWLKAYNTTHTHTHTQIKQIHFQDAFENINKIKSERSKVFFKQKALLKEMPMAVQYLRNQNVRGRRRITFFFFFFFLQFQWCSRYDSVPRTCQAEQVPELPDVLFTNKGSYLTYAKTFYNYNSF